MGVRFFVAGAALALVGLLADPAGAQDVAPGSTVTLPPIVVSPTLVPTPVSEVASSVTVITAADIERTQRRTIADTLMAVPGLNVVQNGTPGSQTSVFIRGTNSNHVKVLIDGVDISDPSSPSGGFDLGHLMTSDIERIEVLRGPQSGLYGADAIGGVIVITTKQGSGPPKATGYVEGGSFGTFNQAAGVRGATDRLNYAFNVSHYRYTDMPVTPAYMLPQGARAIGNAYENTTLSTKLGAALSENLTVNLIGRYTDAKLSYADDDSNTFPGATFATQSTYKNQDFHGRAEAVATLLDGRFVNTFGANYTDYRRTNKDPDPNPLTTYNGTREKYDWHGNFLVMPGQTLVVGLERENDHADSDNVSANTGNQAGFVELQSEIAKRFFFVANVRRDDHDAYGNHTTWRLAPAFIVPGSETKLKASYGTGFKAPELYQLYGVGPYGFVGNPALLPETSRGYDVGFEQPLGPRARFGLTYFRNDIDNLIQSDATYTTLINIGEAQTYGVEAFMSVEVNERLSGRFDYTRTTARNAVTGAELLRRPRDKYSVSAVWRPIDRLTVSPTFIYLGQWVDIDRSTSVTRPGGNVGILNIAVDYAVNNNLTVFARADNLFDKRYEDPLGWEQPGLGIFGGVKVTTN